MRKCFGWVGFKSTSIRSQIADQSGTSKPNAHPQPRMVASLTRSFDSRNGSADHLGLVATRNSQCLRGIIIADHTACPVCLIHRLPVGEHASYRSIPFPRTVSRTARRPVLPPVMGLRIPTWPVGRERDEWGRSEAFPARPTLAPCTSPMAPRHSALIEKAAALRGSKSQSERSVGNRLVENISPFENLSTDYVGTRLIRFKPYRNSEISQCPFGAIEPSVGFGTNEISGGVLAVQADHLGRFLHRLVRVHL